MAIHKDISSSDMSIIIFIFFLNHIYLLVTSIIMHYRYNLCSAKPLHTDTFTYRAVASIIVKLQLDNMVPVSSVIHRLWKNYDCPVKKKKAHIVML